MSRACTHLLFECAFMLSIATPVIGVLPAQEGFRAAARIALRPLTRSGPDSGKVMLSVKVSGIPEVALRAFLSRDKVVVVDELGRSYTAFGYAIAGPPKPAASLVAAYLQPPAENLADRQYIFIVAPSRTYELRFSTLKPVRITPVVAFPVGFPR